LALAGIETESRAVEERIHVKQTEAELLQERRDRLNRDREKFGQEMNSLNCIGGYS